ncbi:MAG: hypothetical protein U0Q18_04580 [Bryobacteraceae bacterium]
MISRRSSVVFLTIVIGSSLLGASSVARAATAYMATGGGAFGTIDLNTGVFTQLGLTNIPVVGLALVGATLYANGQGTLNNRGQLYSVNSATGALMPIGPPAGIDFTAFGSYRGTLYALDHTSSNPNLYSIDSSTGAAALVGPTNTGQPLAGYWAISTNSSALYFSVNSNLYTLNPSTGQATAVGGLGAGIQVGAIAEVGGVLYAGQDSPQPPLRIVTVNQSTGLAAVLSTVTNSPGSNASYIYGLAPIKVQISLATAGQVEPFAAESIVAAYGSGLAGATDTASTLPLPTALDGNSVTVTDSTGAVLPAPLFYISGTQINFEIPAGAAAGNATVTFQNADGTTQSAAIQIGAVSPGIFALDSAGLVAAWVLPVVSGAQQPLQPVYQVADGSLAPLPIDVGAQNSHFYLEIYGTGLRNASIVSVTVGTTSVPVLYFGAAPGYAGLDQLNVGPLPQSLAGAGVVNIVVQADGQAANTVTVAIQ